jgi:anti-sigma factor RsiW
MTPQNMHSVDEELVAAFVDGDVTAEERQRVEAAMAADEQVAWEVNTLRQTVELLQDLPAVPLPRSFVLKEDQVADVLLERRSRAIATAAPAAADQDPQDSPWQRFLRFLNGGDLALRNAAALAAVLLVLFYVAEVQLQQNQVGSPDGSGDQLSQAPSTPQAQVTVVGGTLSQSDGAVADAPASDDSPVADAENGAAQEDGEAEFGVMSTGDQEQETVDSSEQPVAAQEVKPESGVAAEQVARTESSPASAPGTSGETQQSGSENVDDSNQSLLTVFRYARILLVLAVIAFWLFSRIRSRGSRA